MNKQMTGNTNTNKFVNLLASHGKWGTISVRNRLVSVKITYSLSCFSWYKIGFTNVFLGLQLKTVKEQKSHYASDVAPLPKFNS